MKEKFNSQLTTRTHQVLSEVNHGAMSTRNKYGRIRLQFSLGERRQSYGVLEILRVQLAASWDE